MESYIQWGIEESLDGGDEIGFLEGHEGGDGGDIMAEHMLSET